MSARSDRYLYIQWKALSFGIFLVAQAGCGGTTKDAADTSVAPDALQCSVASCDAPADCGVPPGLCVEGVACEQGCCVVEFSPAGKNCSQGCMAGGKCDGAGKCEGNLPVVCPDLDYNPCTRAGCDDATGACGPVEAPVPDGRVPPFAISQCWSVLHCKGGQVDPETSLPSSFEKTCEEEDAKVDPFGCIEHVLCTESEQYCVKTYKQVGTPCWLGSDSKGHICEGTSCNGSSGCVVDPSLSVECGPDDLPEGCDSLCQECTDVSCHWIPDPAEGDSATAKIAYCRVIRDPEWTCSDGNDCTQGDECVDVGNWNGPVGSEVKAACAPGAQWKEPLACWEELGQVDLPCFKAGSSCSADTGGCVFDQAAADAWCVPADPACFDPSDVRCQENDPADPLWDVSTGCHVKMWSAAGCDDSNPCTKDGCDSGAGCVHDIDDEATCDDGDPMTNDDHCAGGLCVGS